MSGAADMNAFLAQVEKRAYNMARIAVRNSEDALDIVQDTMLTLVRKYADKPRDDWRPLFFRILQNRINDHHRRASVSRRLFGWLAPTGPEGEDRDPLDQVAAPDIAEPAARAVVDGAVGELETAVAELPRRQQQVFMLRALEGLSVADTARAMGCSQGSVKTHYSRALHQLRGRLQEHWA